jgi:MFS family permease
VRRASSSARGYIAAIVLNLVIGTLADRFNKLAVLGAIVAVLAVASASLAVEHEVLFRVATAVVIGVGFSAANQLYGLAGTLIPRHETGNAMGIVSLGAGLFGYFGPQMLGILRDTTGSFAAGFYMVAIADVLTLGLIVLLYRLTRRSEEEMSMRRCLLVLTTAWLCAAGAVSAQSSPPTGDQHRRYRFAPTGAEMPYRLYVPSSWDGQRSLPIVLFLHGAGANESTYLDIADGLLRKLAVFG